MTAACGSLLSQHEAAVQKDASELCIWAAQASGISTSASISQA